MARDLFQLRWLENEPNSFTVLIVAGEQVPSYRLVEDQRQVGARQRDLRATSKAWLILEQDLWAKRAHAVGVSSPWLSNR